jgi:hypothetical protein
MNDTLGQFRDEAVHLAFLAIAGGVGLVAAVIGWFIRRDIKLAEIARAEEGLKLAALDEKLADHIRRTGFELNDVKQYVAIFASQVRRELPEANVEIPKWPTR